MKILLLALAICAVVAGEVRADVEFTDANIVRAIIGEASNQGYDGMVHVASGILNRGTLNGVYGVKAKHVDKEPEWVWKMARKAYSEAKEHRTHAGTHWENVKAFGKPYWVDSMREVFRYKDHVFYKEAV